MGKEAKEGKGLERGACISEEHALLWKVAEQALHDALRRKFGTDTQSGLPLRSGAVKGITVRRVHPCCYRVFGAKEVWVRRGYYRGLGLDCNRLLPRSKCRLFGLLSTSTHARASVTALLGHEKAAQQTGTIVSGSVCALATHDEIGNISARMFMGFARAHLVYNITCCAAAAMMYICISDAPTLLRHGGRVRSFARDQLSTHPCRTCLVVAAVAFLTS